MKGVQGTRPEPLSEKPWTEFVAVVSKQQHVRVNVSFDDTGLEELLKYG